MTGNNENLDELLSKFFDQRDIFEIERDIRLGDEILRSHPAPEPAESVVEDIKAQIRAELAGRRRWDGPMVQRIAVAAVIIVIAVAGVKFINQYTAGTGIVPPASTIWADGELGGDRQLARLNAEIDQIEDNIVNIRLDEQDDLNGSDFEELEMELVAFSGDFWKGQ